MSAARPTSTLPIVSAATAAPVTPTTLPNAIHSRSRSIGRTRERWPDGSHHYQTNILAGTERGKGQLRLIRSLEPSDGPRPTTAIPYLPKSVSCTPASRPPAALHRSALCAKLRRTGTGAAPPLHLNQRKCLL